MSSADKPLPQGRFRRTMPVAGFTARAPVVESSRDCGKEPVEPARRIVFTYAPPSAQRSCSATPRA
jgi:hypothetical protein